MTDKVILVGIQLPGVSPEDFEYSMAELYRLTDSAGGEVLCSFTQKKHDINPATYINAGKIDEILQYMLENPADVVVFDNDLNARQQQNLAEQWGCRVLDRTELIIDIFASRAQSKEAQLQVALAQLQYLYPRLSHRYSHFSRLGGGIGTRGPGETKLEMDRRLVKEQISNLRHEIKDVSKQRDLHRQSRKKRGQKVVAIVGYTNAGKSTLLQALSKADVYIKDQLFATLDTLTRKVYMAERNEVVLFSDTVGFIRNLPHNLVDSFKSTLEEATYADMLILLVDINDPDIEDRIKTVYEVLDQLQALDKPILTVFNKIDQYHGSIEKELDSFSPAVAISAQERQGLDQLLSAVAQMLN